MVQAAKDTRRHAPVTADLLGQRTITALLDQILLRHIWAIHRIRHLAGHMILITILGGIEDPPTDRIMAHLPVRGSVKAYIRTGDTRTITGTR